MSEIFTINTEEGIVKEKEEVIEPLSLFDDNHPMLLQRYLNMMLHDCQIQFLVN
jgi:hypothetical protein